MGLTIKWNKKAVALFDKAMAHIEKDSPVNAEKVSKEILLKIESIVQHPEKYNPDKYNKNNDGSFRAFELHRFRISYRLTETDIG